MRFLKKNIRIKPLLLLTAMFLGGCAQMGHDILHNVAKQNCRKQPNPTEQRECEEQHFRADYYEYERTNEYR